MFFIKELLQGFCSALTATGSKLPCYEMPSAQRLRSSTRNSKQKWKEESSACRREKNHCFTTNRTSLLPKPSFHGRYGQKIAPFNYRTTSPCCSAAYPCPSARPPELTASVFSISFSQRCPNSSRNEPLPSCSSETPILKTKTNGDQLKSVTRRRWHR